MAVAFRGISIGPAPPGSQYNSTAAAISGVQAGDLLIAAWASTWENTYVLPPGFTPMRPYMSGATAPAGIVGWKYAGPAEASATYPFTSGGSGYGAFGQPFVAAYSGVAAEGGFLDCQTVGPLASVSSWNFPSIASVPAGGYRLLVLAYGGTVASVNTPAGYTLRAGSGSDRTRFFDQAWAASGATGVTAATATATTNILGWAIHLTPTTAAPRVQIAGALTGNNWNGQSVALRNPTFSGDGSHVVTWKRDGSAI